MPSDLLATVLVAVVGSTGLWTVVNQVVTAIIEKRKAKGKDPMADMAVMMKPIKDMVLGLGYDRLVHVCNKHIEKGWVDPDDLRDINKYLYEPYRELGGNGTAEMLFEKVKGLPSTPPEKREEK